METSKLFKNDVISLIKCKNLEDLKVRYLRRQDRMDEVEILDELHKLFCQKILENLYKLDELEIQEGIAARGLILIIYGIIWDQPNTKTLFSRLSRSVYLDQLKRLLDLIPDEKNFIKKALFARISEFNLSVKDDNSTARYWFVLAVSELFRSFANYFEENNVLIGTVQEKEQVGIDYEIDDLLNTQFASQNTDFVTSEIIGVVPDTLIRLFNENNQIILKGNAGTGKTAWLKYVAATLRQLHLSGDPLVVYLDIADCLSSKFAGMNIFQIIYDIKLREISSNKKELISRMLQLNSEEQLIVMFGNFNKLHKFNELDMRIRKAAYLVAEQQRILDWLRDCQRYVIEVFPWQADLLIEKLQGLSDNTLSVKAINLTDHENCYEKIFEDRWSKLLIPNQESLREHTKRRYELFFTDFIGVEVVLDAAAKYQAEFLPNQHCRILYDYLNRISALNGLEGNVEIIKRENVHLFKGLLKICFLVAEKVLLHLASEKLPHMPMFVSVDEIFPMRDRERNGLFIMAINSNLFALQWINNTLFIRFYNNGVLAAFLSLFNESMLYNLFHKCPEESLERAVVSSALNYSRPYSVEERDSSIRTGRLDPIRITSDIDPFDFVW